MVRRDRTYPRDAGVVAAPMTLPASWRAVVEPGGGLAPDAMGEVLVSRERADPPDVVRFDPVAKAEATVTAGSARISTVVSRCSASATGIRTVPIHSASTAVEEQGGARETLASLRPRWRTRVRHGGAAVAPGAEPSRLPRESP
jgi:hypothetical protein